MAGGTGQHWDFFKGVMMTQIIIVAAVVFLLLYDLFAFVVGGVQNTISYLVIQWSKRYPIIPFAFGVLAGHWFWEI